MPSPNLVKKDVPGHASPPRLAQELDQQSIEPVGALQRNPVPSVFEQLEAPGAAYVTARGRDPVREQGDVMGAQMPSVGTRTGGRGGGSDTSAAGAALARYQFRAADNAPGRDKSST
jgi:hypothetical protein